MATITNSFEGVGLDLLLTSQEAYVSSVAYVSNRAEYVLSILSNLNNWAVTPSSATNAAAYYIYDSGIRAAITGTSLNTATPTFTRVVITDGATTQTLTGSVSYNSASQQFSGAWTALGLQNGSYSENDTGRWAMGSDPVWTQLNTSVPTPSYGILTTRSTGTFVIPIDANSSRTYTAVTISDAYGHTASISGLNFHVTGSPEAYGYIDLLRDMMAGADTVTGTTGSQVLQAFAGNDIYVVDNINDIVVENANEGTDTIQSSIDFTLPDNVENLTLTGTAGITGTGNALANAITGNSGSNLISGGTGIDTLTGGLGGDVFFYAANGNDIDRIADFGAGDRIRIDGAALSGAAASGNGAQVGRNQVQFAAGILSIGTDDTPGADIQITLTGSYGASSFGLAGSDIVFNRAPTGSVTLSGTSAQGQTLTAANTLADADGIGTVRYQWQTSPDGTTWSPLANATGNSLSLSDALVGLRIRALASYTDAQGSAESVASAATVSIANVNDLPGGSVVVSGSVEEGQTLVASHSLTDADGLGSISYQWQGSSNGTTWNALGSGSSLSLTAAQVDQQIRVVASYTDGHGAATSVNSAATALVTLALNRIYGTQDPDTLSGTPVRDVMAGYGGDDTYLIDSAADTVIEAPNAGIDTIQADISQNGITRFVSKVFALFGSTKFSAPRLQTPDNVENLLLAGDTNSTLLGNDLDNRLTGNGASNVLYGRGGNDVLGGGGGHDRYVGGSGADTFVIDRVANMVAAIADFNAAEGDRIALAGNEYANLFQNGTLAANVFATATTNNFSGTDQRLLYNTQTGALWYDGDGTASAAAPVQIAALSAQASSPAVQAANFCWLAG